MDGCAKMSGNKCNEVDCEGVVDCPCRKRCKNPEREALEYLCRELSDLVSYVPAVFPEKDLTVRPGKLRDCLDVVRKLQKIKGI